MATAAGETKRMRNESEERERNPSERDGEEEEEEEEEEEGEEEKRCIRKPALYDRLGAREKYTQRPAST